MFHKIKYTYRYLYFTTIYSKGQEELSPQAILKIALPKISAQTVPKPYCSVSSNLGGTQKKSWRVFIKSQCAWILRRVNCTGLFPKSSLASAVDPVNILDVHNWEEHIVGVPCAYPGLLHHPHMQIRTACLFRDHLSTNPPCIKIAAPGMRVERNSWNKFTASP